MPLGRLMLLVVLVARITSVTSLTLSYSTAYSPLLVGGSRLQQRHTQEALLKCNQRPPWISSSSCRPFDLTSSSFSLLSSSKVLSSSPSSSSSSYLSTLSSPTSPPVSSPFQPKTNTTATITTTTATATPVQSPSNTNNTNRVSAVDSASNHELNNDRQGKLGTSRARDVETVSKAADIVNVARGSNSASVVEQHTRGLSSNAEDEEWRFTLELARLRQQLKGKTLEEQMEIIKPAIDPLYKIERDGADGLTDWLLTSSGLADLDAATTATGTATSQFDIRPPIAAPTIMQRQVEVALQHLLSQKELSGTHFVSVALAAIQQAKESAHLVKQQQHQIKDVPLNLPRYQLLPKKVRSFYNDKVVWITGASSGIGERLAVNAALCNAKVILSGRNVEELNRVAAICRACWKDSVDYTQVRAFVYGWNAAEVAQVLPLDVLDVASFPKAVELAERVYNRPIDVLICNAGISSRSNVIDTSLEVDKKVMDTNFWSAVALTKVVLGDGLVGGFEGIGARQSNAVVGAPRHSGMLDRGEGGNIVVVSGVHGLVPVGGRSSNVAAKHALRGYFGALRCELAKDNIGVTIIYPGLTRTNLGKHALLGDGTPHGTLYREAEEALAETEAAPGRMAGMDPDYVASKTLVAVAKGKKEVVVAGLIWRWKLFWNAIRPS